MTLKDLANLYNISESTFWRYRESFKTEFDQLASRYTFKNKEFKRTDLNKKQITFLVTSVMQDPPEGYKLKRGKLIKLTDND